MLDDCDGTSIYSISNSMVVKTSDTVIINNHVVVSHTDSNATLVGFGHVFSILNVDSTASIDLPNGVIIAHINGSSLIQIRFNSLVSTVQHHNFVIATYAVFKNHSTQQYIHTELFQFQMSRVSPFLQTKNIHRFYLL